MSITDWDKLDGKPSADEFRRRHAAQANLSLPEASLSRPRLLDLFCGAGGAAMGYHRAGFEVVGVDIKPQPRYPFEFIQADALKFLSALLQMKDGDWDGYRRFDAIHASPPCQAHVRGLAAVNRKLGREYAHVDLISATRELLRSSGLPYVIENVVGAPLENPVKLCGSSFNLAVRRHRLFECSFPLLVPPCDHSRQSGDYWTSWRPNGEKRRAKVVQVYGNAGDRTHWNEAMGIDWMEWKELAEAIPPAYTEHIGQWLMREVTRPLEVARGL
jgi:DNA (cytosine-5)-methyltransferase 1